MPGHVVSGDTRDLPRPWPRLPDPLCPFLRLEPDVYYFLTFVGGVKLSFPTIWYRDQKKNKQNNFCAMQVHDQYWRIIEFRAKYHDFDGAWSNKTGSGQWLRRDSRCDAIKIKNLNVELSELWPNILSYLQETAIQPKDRKKYSHKHSKWWAQKYDFSTSKNDFGTFGGNVNKTKCLCNR